MTEQTIALAVRAIAAGLGDSLSKEAAEERARNMVQVLFDSESNLRDLYAMLRPDLCGGTELEERERWYLVEGAVYVWINLCRDPKRYGMYLELLLGGFDRKEAFAMAYHTNAMSC